MHGSGRAPVDSRSNQKTNPMQVQKLPSSLLPPMLIEVAPADTCNERCGGALAHPPPYPHVPGLQAIIDWADLSALCKAMLLPSCMKRRACSILPACRSGHNQQLMDKSSSHAKASPENLEMACVRQCQTNDGTNIINCFGNNAPNDTKATSSDLSRYPSRYPTRNQRRNIVEHLLNMSGNKDAHPH